MFDQFLYTKRKVASTNLNSNIFPPVVIFLSPVFRSKKTHDTRNVGSAARFNIRHMSGVFSGLLQAKPGEFAEAEKVRRGPGSDGVAGWVLPFYPAEMVKGWSLKPGKMVNIDGVPGKNGDLNIFEPQTLD